MTNEQRIQANADKGYILVASFDGWEIYKKLNEVGGWTYYSDQIGYEGAYPIWDTAVRSNEELIALVNDMGTVIEQQIDRQTELWRAFGSFYTAIHNRMERENNGGDIGAITDPIDGYPVGTNDSLHTINYHLLRINQAIFIHLQHQQAIANNPKWQEMVKLASSSLGSLQAEVEQERKKDNTGNG